MNLAIIISACLLSAGCLAMGCRDMSAEQIRNCSGETYNRRLVETVDSEHAKGATCPDMLKAIDALESDCHFTHNALTCPDGGK